MTAFALSGVFGAISNLIFGFLVYLKSRNELVGKLWFVFTIAASSWGIGSYFIGSNSINSELGMRYCTLAYALGVIWISPLFYHFVSVFIEKSKTSLVITHYLIALFFLLLLPTQYFFNKTELLFGEFFYARMGILFPVFFLWWAGLILLCQYKLFVSMRKVSFRKRTQIKYFLIATSIGYFGGFLCFLPNFYVDIYPYGNFLLGIYPIIMAYAILKYSLLDVRIFLRRATLGIILYIGLILVSIPVVYLLHKKIISTLYMPFSLFFFEIIMVACVLSTGPFIYAYLIKRNQYFQEGDFSALTHELKSPLSAIHGALDMIKHHQGNKEEYIEMIQKNSDRLTDYVQSLLQIYQPNQKMCEENFHDVEISTVIEKLIPQYESLAKQKKYPTSNKGPIK
ncbi:MAG: histidine kinase dimerization/phospho-acceptor domain-containing protein [Elusimicrobiota bacterium]